MCFDFGQYGDVDVFVEQCCEGFLGVVQMQVDGDFWIVCVQLGEYWYYQVWVVGGDFEVVGD